jgi:hypothetical protein
VSTQGAWGFRFGGCDKVAYNSHDSYPDGPGTWVLAAVVKFDDDRLARAADRLMLVESDERPPRELIKRYSALSYGSEDELLSSKWLTWRDLLATNPIQAFIDGRIDHLPDDHTFLEDSLYCDWAYILNLDERVAECYEGFNREPGGPGRYAGLGPNEGGYYGVRLRAVASFEEIRARDYTRVVDNWTFAARGAADADDVMTGTQMLAEDLLVGDTVRVNLARSKFAEPDLQWLKVASVDDLVNEQGRETGLLWLTLEHTTRHGQTITHKSQADNLSPVWVTGPRGHSTHRGKRVLRPDYRPPANP